MTLFHITANRITHNKALQTQKESREAIIAVQAVLQDRELEDGDSNTVTSEITED